MLRYNIAPYTTCIRLNKADEAVVYAENGICSFFIISTCGFKEHVLTMILHIPSFISDIKCLLDLKYTYMVNCYKKTEGGKTKWDEMDTEWKRGTENAQQRLIVPSSARKLHDARFPNYWSSKHMCKAPDKGQKSFVFLTFLHMHNDLYLYL